MSGGVQKFTPSALNRQEALNKSAWYQIVADKSIKIQNEVTRNHEYAITEILETKIVVRKKVLCIMKIVFQIILS